MQLHSVRQFDRTVLEYVLIAKKSGEHEQMSDKCEDSRNFFAS